MPTEEELQKAMQAPTQQNPPPVKPLEEITEEEEPAAYTEQQLGQMILKVYSRLGRKRNKDGKWVETGYIEILTPDMTSAFLDDTDLSTARNMEQLLSMLRSFAGTYSIDMKEAYNFIAHYHNALVISSKSTGKGAKVSRSQYVEQKGTSRVYDERRKQSKLEQMLAKLAGEDK